MKGGCLCGTVRYEATGEPLWSVYCHCHSCRRHTASPVAAFVGFQADDVAFNRDRARYASSPGVSRSFCDRCGTPLAYESEDAPGEIHLYTVTLDEPGTFPPTRHVFHGERLPWFDIHDDLPRHDQGGSGEPDSFGPAHR